MKSIKREGMRFLVAGGLNTLLTYLVYLALLHVVGYVLAFSLSFVLGIGIAFVIYTLFVFQSPLTWRKMLQYPFLYVAQYAAGLLLLVIIVEYIGLDKRIAPIINLILLTPLTFLLNRWFLAERIT